MRAYERERSDFRARVIALKKRRRVHLGEFVTLVFENRDTIRFQIQEMARIEKLITDEAIQELYVLARDAFARGQRDFPVHAFPFRMTKEAMAFRAGNQWQEFWLNLKQGYDIFEKSRLPPVVGVKDRQYVFFADQGTVPEEFRSANANDPLAPQLISGWHN